jgi:hypothetical protein
MLGPRDEEWVSRGDPRPFDSDSDVGEVDGFGLDIEHPPEGRWHVSPLDIHE